MRCLTFLGLALLGAGPLLAQERTRSPHGDLQLECKACHKSGGWTPVQISKSFDHNRVGFKLLGAHQTATCRACHAALDFKGITTDCAGCHRDIHRGELGSDCSRCHSTRSFLDRDAMQKSHQTTRFPLSGAHLAVDCTACHTPGAQGRLQFVTRSVDCVSCHEAQYLATTAPNHAQSGIPRDCGSCHVATSWGTGRFNHDATAFPLTGAHRATPCQECHTSNRYRGTPSDCALCHRADYDRTTSPNHAQASFPTTCTQCHTTTSWLGSGFNHDATRFPLTGAHRTATCTQCHADGVYSGKAMTCISCHQPDYNTATKPDHRQAQFASTCTDCHTTTAWTPASFSHDQTQFPLTGAHRAVTCDQCHGDGVYRGKPTTCVTCHQTDYNNTADPKHSTAGFSTDCTTCHTTTQWQGAVFNHDATQFPLTGFHRSVACNQCHADGVYSGKLTTCVSCHQLDYNNTSNPKHTAAGFSTDCKSCHTTTQWLGATFNHAQWFPTPHHGISTCTDCHTNANDYLVFACITCHTHNKTSTDDQHRGRSGYTYDSPACLRCHPRGSGG